MTATPTIQDVRILRAGGDAARWRDAIAAATFEAWPAIKIERGRRVCRGRLFGMNIVVKTERARGLSLHLRMLMGLSRLRRQWRGAEILLDAGVPTARPLALARGRRNGKIIEALIMEELPGPSLLALWLQGGLSLHQEHALARAAGEVVARCVQRGIFNRDGKPSNLIVTRLDDGGAALAVIDTIGVRRSSAPGGGVRMLASLYIEAWGMGRAPRRALCALALRPIVELMSSSGGESSHVRRRLWKATRAIIRSHGDPKPKVNPLSGRGFEMEDLQSPR